MRTALHHRCRHDPIADLAQKLPVQAEAIFMMIFQETRGTKMREFDKARRLLGISLGKDDERDPGEGHGYLRRTRNRE
jgi:hypothetical protein